MRYGLCILITGIIGLCGPVATQAQTVQNSAAAGTNQQQSVKSLSRPNSWKIAQNTTSSTSSSSAASQTAQLQSLRQTLSSGTTRNLWNYFRSFINYALVIVLIIAAFANVLRINVDTYGVKKVLPGLAIGFILANISNYIVLLGVDFAQVLANTANEIFSSASGGRSISQVIGTEYPGVVIALIFAGGSIGAILAPFSAGASAGIGLIIGLLIGIFVMFFPVLILAGLYVVFLARYYVIQFLFIVSPLAFLCIGLPGMRKYFDKWWDAFTTWALMKPMAYFILALAGFVLVAKPGGGTLVPFLVGSIAMVYALILPFRAGGKITATINKYGRRGLNLGLGAAGSTSAAAGKLATSGAADLRQAGYGRLAAGLGAVGTGLSGLPKIKTAVEGRYEEQKKKEEARQTAAAYSTLKDTRKENALFDAEVSEYEKTIDDNADQNELLSKAKEAKTETQHVAVQNKIQKSKNSHKVYASLLGDEAYMSKYKDSLYLYEKDEDGKIKNSSRNRELLKVQMAGGGVKSAGTEGVAADQDKVIVTSSQHHKRARARQQNIAKSNGFGHEASTTDKNGNINSVKEIDEGAAGQMTGGDALSTAAKPNYDDWVDRKSDRKPVGFTQAFLIAARTGAYNPMIDNNNALKNLSGFAISELANVDRDILDQQLSSVPALLTTAPNAKKNRKDLLLDQIDRSRKEPS